jgi:cytochrome bd-type quinol oxidase subunit 2
MKKILQILMSFLLFLNVLLIANICFAADGGGLFPLPSAHKFGDLPDTVSDSGTRGAQVIIDKISTNAKYLIGAIAIGIIVFAGFRLVAQGTDENVLTEQKKNLLIMLVGLAILGLALPLSTIVSFQDGGPFSNTYEITERVNIFKSETMIVIKFIKYVLGSVAVLFIVLSGAELITSMKDEGAIDKVKKKLGVSILGLILVMFSGTLIDKILYKVDFEKAETESGVNPMIDANSAMAEIIAITNFIITFIGPLLIIVFVASGIMYVLSFQDEGRMDTAKKWMKNSVIGLLVVYGAFAIVSTFISGNVG